MTCRHRIIDILDFYVKSITMFRFGEPEETAVSDTVKPDKVEILWPDGNRSVIAATVVSINDKPVQAQSEFTELRTEVDENIQALNQNQVAFNARLEGLERLVHAMAAQAPAATDVTG